MFFRYRELNLVLRHYYRGGLVAKLVRDWYVGLRLENTRAFREWCLLRTMKNLCLPVPTPVAARVIKSTFFYRADLVTVQLENSETLADYLMQAALNDYHWRKIGVCIKRFHSHHIFHADLNARNILLKRDSPDEFEIYLIDFDRGAVRSGVAWQSENLARLQRSLEKFKRRNTGFYFDSANWRCLLDGYGDIGGGKKT